MGDVLYWHTLIRHLIYHIRKVAQSSPISDGYNYFSTLSYSNLGGEGKGQDKAPLPIFGLN